MPDIGDDKKMRFLYAALICLTGVVLFGFLRHIQHVVLLEHYLPIFLICVGIIAKREKKFFLIPLMIFLLSSVFWNIALRLVKFSIVSPRYFEGIWVAFSFVDLITAIFLYHCCCHEQETIERPVGNSSTVATEDVRKRHTPSVTVDVGGNDANQSDDAGFLDRTVSVIMAAESINPPDKVEVYNILKREIGGHSLDQIITSVMDSKTISSDAKVNIYGMLRREWGK